MGRQTFVNLPVRNLDSTKEFFEALGFEFNPMFSDDKAACLVISDDTFVMLLVEEFYQTFTKKKIVDTNTHNEVILCLSAGSREEVDEVVHEALAAGGKPAGDPVEEGPMYGWSFEDLDGHQWELLYMDPTALTG